jgi:hypothetical protein
MGTCPDYQGFLDTFIQSGYTPHDSNTLQPVTVGKQAQFKLQLLLITVVKSCFVHFDGKVPHQ